MFRSYDHLQTEINNSLMRLRGLVLDYVGTETTVTFTGRLSYLETKRPRREADQSP
jgi:hypothetical protein